MDIEVNDEEFYLIKSSLVRRVNTLKSSQHYVRQGGETYERLQAKIDKANSLISKLEEHSVTV